MKGHYLKVATVFVTEHEQGDCDHRTLDVHHPMEVGPERRPSLLGRQLAEEPLELEVQADLVIGDGALGEGRLSPQRLGHGAAHLATSRDELLYPLEGQRRRVRRRLEDAEFLPQPRRIERRVAIGEGALVHAIELVRELDEARLEGGGLRRLSRRRVIEARDRDV